MLRCWNVLVSLKLMERYEDVMAKLKRVAIRLKRILAGEVAVVPYADTNEVQGRRNAYSFDPP
jgi:hypothetical protein